MSADDQLKRRYADLIEPESDVATRQLVEELDRAAAPYRTLEPPPALDQAIELLAAQRQLSSATDHTVESFAQHEPVHTFATDTRWLRLRTSRTGQLLGMAAAIVVVVLFAGLIAVLLREPTTQPSGGVGGAASPAPTTFHNGSYDHLSFAEAQQLVGFTIVQPNPLPDVLQPIPDSSVLAATIGQNPAAKPNYIFFDYPAQDMDEKGISVVETTAPAAVPAIEGNTLRFSDQRDTPVSTKYDQLSHTTVTIDGVKLTRIVAEREGAQIVYYTWQKDGVSFVTYTIPGPQVTEAVFKQFVAALITPAGTPTTSNQPVPTLTAAQRGNVSFADAQKAVAFHLAEPQWLPPYLAPQGIQVGSAAPVLLRYGSPDGGLAYSVLILEYTENAHAQPPGIPSALTINGHVVAHGVGVIEGGSHSFFIWHDQGTIFQLDAKLAGPFNEQDVEHMVASMLGAGAPAPTSSAVPAPDADGRYLGLTLAQAQQLAPFRIIMPTDIAPVLKYGGLELETPPVAPVGVPRNVPSVANIMFTSTDDPKWTVMINERMIGINPTAVPSPTVAAPTSTATSGPVDQSLPPTFQIGGVTITKEMSANMDKVPFASYRWTQGNTIITLALGPFNHAPREIAVASMIQSMIAQGE